MENGMRLIRNLIWDCKHWHPIRNALWRIKNRDCTCDVVSHIYCDVHGLAATAAAERRRRRAILEAMTSEAAADGAYEKINGFADTR